MNEYMKLTTDNRAWGCLVILALGLWTRPAGATVLVQEHFNYTPVGIGLDGANGGSGTPGWSGAWVATANAANGAGLTYSSYSLGQGNSAVLGDAATLGEMSRSISAYANATEIWMRVLYRPGIQDDESTATVAPFELFTANLGKILSLERTVEAAGTLGDPTYTLNLIGETVGSTSFNLTGTGTRMLLFRLTVNQTAGQEESLALWVDPTANTPGGLGAPLVSINGDVLIESDVGLADDYLAYFSASGLGDGIDEILIATTFDEAIASTADPVTDLGFIAEDAFDYCPTGVTLDGANGGAGAPGWSTVWSANAAVVGTGLGYGGAYGLGLGNGAILGDVSTPGDVSRGITDYGAGAEVWIRMLYTPGAQVVDSPNFVTPLELDTANAGNFITLEREVGATGVPGDELYTLNMVGDNNASAYLNLPASGTRLLVFRLTVNQTAGAAETLDLWVNPSATTTSGLGTPLVSISADVLTETDVGLADDYLAYFFASGLGDELDELAVCRSFTAAITPSVDSLRYLNYIAEDAFTDTPTGAGLFGSIPIGTGVDGANGGGGAPGWLAVWSADAGATVGAGLTYNNYGGYAYSLGQGNSLVLGVGTGENSTTGSASRAINNYGAVSELWMRVLYKEGAHDEGSAVTVVPFALGTANLPYYLSLERTVAAEVGEGGLAYSLNLVGDTVGSIPFTMPGLSADTRMLVFRLTINQATGQEENLALWVNPTATTTSGLGTPLASINGDILIENTPGAADDYFAWFAASGLGDTIDELVIGRSFADVLPHVTATGQIELESFTGTGTVPTHTRTVTLVATATGSTTPLKTWQLPLFNANGATMNYTLTDVPVATANISAKTDWNLRKKLAVTLVNGQPVADFTGSSTLLGGDINATHDNSVNGFDRGILLQQWGKSAPGNAAADITGDGNVNGFDRARLLNTWGKTGDLP
jgi:hypothetical protein